MTTYMGLPGNGGKPDPGSYLESVSAKAAAVLSGKSFLIIKIRLVKIIKVKRDKNNLSFAGAFRSRVVESENGIFIKKKIVLSFLGSNR
jgi:hypothetical protein